MALLIVSPFSPDMACRHMVVADVFDRLNINYLSDFTAEDGFFYPAVKRSVSENKANHYFASVILGTAYQLTHFLFIDSKRLFKQNVVACFEQRDRCCNVDVIHRSVYSGIGEFRYRNKVTDILKAILTRNIKIFTYLITSKFIWIDNTDYLKHFGICFCQPGVYHRAMAATDYDGF